MGSPGGSSDGFWFTVGKRERAVTKSVGARLCVVVVAAAAVASLGDLVGRNGFGRSGSFRGCGGR